MKSDYVSDFAFRGLVPFLSELQCDAATQSRLIDWYWKNAPLWVTESLNSQHEFDAIAKLEIRAELSGRDERDSGAGSEVYFREQFRRERRRLVEIGRKNEEVRRAQGLYSYSTEEERSQQEARRWKPCTHWGGTKDSCSRCQKPVSIALAQAQAMFDEHRAFVLDRIACELSRYLDGQSPRSYSAFALPDNKSYDLKKLPGSDIENEVWKNVAVAIPRFIPNPALKENGVLAWLRPVVESTVKMHFRREWAKKRGTAVTRQLPEDSRGRGIVNPSDPTFAKPTAVPVKPEKDTRFVVTNEAEMPFFKK
jgi:hypothetical protein